MVLALVRDLNRTRVVYYWIDKHQLVRISPVLSSFQLADEWRLRHLHESHTGKNRRRSHIDRRKIYSKTSVQDKRVITASNLGRRASDHPTRVHIDIAKVKLAELRLVFQENILHASDIDQRILFDTLDDDTR